MATGDKIYIGIKSIQRGSVALAYKTNVTLNEVNMDKTIVIVSPAPHTADTGIGDIGISAKLTSSNQLTIYTNTNNTSAYVEYQVIEFY